MPGVLEIVCRRCTKGARFEAKDVPKAVKKATDAGWRMRDRHEFYCPVCWKKYFNFNTGNFTNAVKREEPCPTTKPL